MTSTKKGLKFREHVSTLLDLRDYIHPILVTTDKNSVESRTWSAYKNWFENQERRWEAGEDASTHAMVRALGIREKFGDKLDAPWISQCFAYGQRLRPYVPLTFAEDMNTLSKVTQVDFRAWDIFMDNNFSSGQITCEFLRSSMNHRTRKTPSRTFWETFPPSTFEIVLFLSMLSALGTKRGEPKAKSRKLSAQGERGKRSYRRTRDCSQRVAHVVQCIVRAWDALARSANFQGIEQLAAPYMLYSFEQGRFTALSSRDRGYARSAQSFRFNSSTCSSTMQAEDTYTGVTLRDQNFDQVLRELVALFLGDLDAYILHKDLFAQAEKEWNFISLFREPSIGARSLSSRFDEILSLVKGLQEASGTGIEHHQVVFPKESAAHVTPAVMDISTTGPIAQISSTNARRSSSLSKRVDEDSCHAHCRCIESRLRIRKYMGNFVRVYHSDFADIEEKDSLLRPENHPDIRGKVKLVLSDPPFNIRAEQERRNSHYDSLTLDDMWNVAITCSDLLMPGGHVFLFCSAEQFGNWVSCFTKCREDSGNEKEEEEEEEEEDGDDNDDDEDEEGDGKAALSFIVDKHDFTMVNAPGHYNSYPGKFSTSFMSVTTKAIHAVRRGAGDLQNSLVEYKNYGYIPSRYAGFCNVLDNVPRMEPGEPLRMTRPGDRSSSMVRAEQKSVRLLQELVSRLSLPGDIVVDLFGGTFSLAVACLTLEEEGSKPLRTFVGTESDKECFEVALRNLDEVFARVLLTAKHPDTFFGPYIPTAKHIEDARLLLAHAGYKSITETTTANVSRWKPPADLPVLSVLPPWIMRHLSTLWRDTSLARTLLNRPYHTWPRSLAAKLHTVDRDNLLAVEENHCQVYIAKSNIKHPDAGDGLFANRRFARGDLICTYYGMLLYRNLNPPRENGGSESQAKTYGDGVLAVTLDQFNRLCMRLPISEHAIWTDPSTGKEHRIEQVYVVPFLSCVGAKINDARYTERDGERIKSTPRRTPNARVEPKRINRPASKLRHLYEMDALRIIATDTIAVDQEIYLDYGKEYKMK